MQIPNDSTLITVLRHPEAPEVVRLGATVTAVVGFGPIADAVRWMAGAVPPGRAVEILGVDDLDGALEPEPRRAAIDAELDALELRADAIEAELAELDASGSSARAAEALALAVEWERHRARAEATRGAAHPGDGDRGGASDADGAVDVVVGAHLQVERLRNLLAAASRAERRELAARFDTARATERAMLAAAGCASYADYLATRAAVSPPRVDPVDPDRGSADSQRDALEAAGADLRARAAAILGHAPDGDPAAELRAVVVAGPADDDRRGALEAELAAVDERGNALAGARAHLGGSAAELAELTGRGDGLLLVDGRLFAAVTSDVYRQLLHGLLEASAARQVAVVSDDAAIAQWAETAPGGTVWTVADSHRVRASMAPATVAWNAQAQADLVAHRLGVHADGNLRVCVNHPGAVTRLTCSICGKPSCDLCLMRLEPQRLACVACALDRAGVRRRRR